MFSMLVFMCRDPGDTTRKVSCCIEPSRCFKNSGFDAIVKLPLALPLKIILTRKLKYGKSLKWLFRRNYAFTQRFDSGTFTEKAYVAFWREFPFKAVFCNPGPALHVLDVCLPQRTRCKGMGL